MTFDDPAELKRRIVDVAGRRVYGEPVVLTDTTSYMSIAAGTVLRLEGRDYYVTGDAREGRFGIEDQPKLWVKHVVDLETGAKQILKLVFHERFTTSLGAFTIRCMRNPDKESQVLDLARGDVRFMQGRTVRDTKGNNVRVIDRIRGKTFFNYVANLRQSHEAWFAETLPGVLRQLVGCIEALAHLQDNGLQHGDVRNDHIYVERDTGAYRWIDFDYEVNYQDYDVWSVGNVLTYAVGKGIHTCREAGRSIAERGAADATICPDEALLFYSYRFANLRRLFPYIPEDVNDLLMRFSAGTVDFYEDLGKLARDVAALSLLR